MKKLVIIFCLLLSARMVLAQTGNNGGIIDATQTGQVTGKLLDATGNGIEFVDVLVFESGNDTAHQGPLIKGIATDSSGGFSLNGLPLNTPLVLKASSTGYTSINKNILLSSAGKKTNLGSLLMKTDKTVLKEVTVTGTKPYMTVDMDKKVYNATKDMVSAGGTGLDLLKNVPGVNVDVDGNVTIRSGSPQIFVDGKPTILTLDQVPASSIESVEIMNNPSAKYDASGGGTGILNVVLKKNRKSGYNGNVRGGVDSHNGVNGGGSLNVKTSKFNISADVNARESPDYTKVQTNRLNTSATPVVNLQQNQLDTGRNSMFFGKLSIDYYLSKRTTISLSSFMIHHRSHNTSDININSDSLYSTGNTGSYTHEDIDTRRTFNGGGGTLNFTHNFAKEKEVWTVDANYFAGSATGTSQYANYYYGDANVANMKGYQLQRIESNGGDHNIVLQTDYTNPLTKTKTLEAGVRAQLNSRRNNNGNYTYDSTTDVYKQVATAASNYKSQSNVFAAYTTLSGMMGAFTYKAGLRVESSSYNGTLLNSGQAFSNKYPLSLFPSLFVGRKLSKGQEIQLSYTRRVNRPNFFQLIPYTDSSNKLNITRGNPALVPEFTQSLELSYIKNFKKGTFMGSVYYKHTDHLITGYIESDTNAATGALTYVNTYVNANSSYSTGSELTGQFSPTKWWDLISNVNIYRSRINVGSESTITQQPALWSWFGKLNMSFKLPTGFGLQLTGTYQSKTNIPVNISSGQPGPPDMSSQSASQGYINPYWFVDIALRKEFHKGKLIASASVNDIFKTRKQVQYTYSDYFTQDYSRLKNARLFRLTLIYNFGKLERKPFEKKGSDVQMEE